MVRAGRWVLSVSMVWMTSNAAHATEACSPVRARPAPSEPALLQVPPDLAVLCLPDPVELAPVLGVGEPLPFSCEGRCRLNDEPAEGIYRIEADGQLRRVVRREQLWHTIEPGDSAVRKLALGPAVPMVARAEAGECVALPEGMSLSVGETHVAVSQAHAAVLEVVEGRTDAPAAPKLRPQQPRFEGIACRDHGVYLWEGRPKTGLLRWRVLASDGTTEIVAPWISHGLQLAGFEEDEAKAGELVIGRHYVVEAQAITRDGRISPPTRIEFDLRQTGEGDPAPGQWSFIVWAAMMLGIALLALLGLVGAIALVVLVVIRLRGRRSRTPG
ncbi:MAG: hypothetical protein AAF799_36275 [Myxococcota bacterium]